MPSPMPQNDEEAAYISFALFEALIDRLVENHIIPREDFISILKVAEEKLSAGPNNACRRGALFIRERIPTNREPG
jgi:hypothetical protein